MINKLNQNGTKLPPMQLIELIVDGLNQLETKYDAKFAELEQSNNVLPQNISAEFTNLQQSFTNVIEGQNQLTAGVSGLQALVENINNKVDPVPVDIQEAVNALTNAQAQATQLMGIIQTNGIAVAQYLSNNPVEVAEPISVDPLEDSEAIALG